MFKVLSIHRTRSVKLSIIYNIDYQPGHSLTMQDKITELVMVPNILRSTQQVSGIFWVDKQSEGFISPTPIINLLLSSPVGDVRPPGRSKYGA